uniref:Taste receptor type 2 n=1 Tax=Salmo trutta TaxID=8032 RepID=A0A673XSJ5_SALTR
MVGSSCATVCYLQMRVTIAGILQGIIFLFTEKELWTTFTPHIETHTNSECFYAAYLIMVYMAATSMSTSVWLNFFYYTQIVPAQRALFTWVKRNIKSIIYWGLFGDRMFFMFQFAVRAAGEFYSSGEGPTNSTGFTSTYSTPKDDAAFLKDVLLDASTASLFLEMIYVFFCLCVMVGSSCATVCYLHRHMKSMKESGSPFSSPRLHSQMRVTIAGILQGIIFFFTAVWILIHYLSNVLSSTYFDDKTLYTVISLYMFGTTLNLGIGQVVFRERAADIWLKAQQAVK